MLEIVCKITVFFANDQANCEQLLEKCEQNTIFVDFMLLPLARRGGKYGFL